MGLYWSSKSQERTGNHAAVTHCHHRGAARPWAGAARRGYGALGDARGQPERARGVAGVRGGRPGMFRSNRPKPCRRAIVQRQVSSADRRHLRAARGRVEQALARGNVPLVLGGDHSVAIGTVAACRSIFAGRAKAGLIWLDAHADMNTPETSPSGNIHGMPLACLLGMGPAGADRTCWATAPSRCRTTRRSWDCATWIRWRGRTCANRASAPSPCATSMSAACAPLWTRPSALASDGIAGFHLSFDLDFVDPKDAPGVGTPVRGGATYREAHLAMEMICDSWSHGVASKWWR